MDTFGTWEETVLNKTYENIDFVSCHAYYHPELQADGTRDMKSFLASGVDMDGFIKDMAAAVDANTLHDGDLLAANTLDDHNRVTLHPNTTAVLDAANGTVRVTLPPVSWTAVHVA